MNIFEDLIDELKQDNLLEETVIKTNSEKNESAVSEENILENDVIPIDKPEEKTADANEAQILSASYSELQEKSEAASQKNTGSDTVNIRDFEINQIERNDNSGVEAEFYRKRAINEVSFLQMVERVFAGLEREQMKIVPKPIDDLEVKKSLHAFLQISKESNSNEQAQAEFQLLQETESWFSSLTHRDKRISINHLRRYCESTRPPLSSPALVSLARFYRNSPYSEQARGKFDFVITRLFSKDIKNERREMIFSREELTAHLKEFYAEWSSIPLYSTEEDDSETLLVALKFEDFMTEAAVAGSFDDLIRNDFFNRLRLFKKSTNEGFFSPPIVAAAIESNIKIGNRYVELLEKEQSNKSIFEDKYGFLHDQTISDATGKTLQLVELLNRKIEKTAPVESKPRIKKEIKVDKDIKKETNAAQKTIAVNETKTVKEKPKPEIYSIAKETNKENKSHFNINSWLLTATIFVIIASSGLYIWSNNYNSASKENASVKNVNLENSSLKESIKSARIEGATFYAVVLPSWNNLDKTKKEELLKKIISIGVDKGFKQAQLLNGDNKPVGIASADKVEIFNP